jgi:hypothetical protein
MKVAHKEPEWFWFFLYLLPQQLVHDGLVFLKEFLLKHLQSFRPQV